MPTASSGRLQQTLPNRTVLNCADKCLYAEPIGIKRGRFILALLPERLQLMPLIAQGYFNHFARDDAEAINHLAIKLNRGITNPRLLMRAYIQHQRC